MRVHKLGKPRSRREVVRQPVEARLCSSWNLLLVFSRCNTPSIFIIWLARIWWGSGALVVISMTGLARVQSSGLASRCCRRGPRLALALVGNHGLGGFVDNRGWITGTSLAGCRLQGEALGISSGWNRRWSVFLGGSGGLTSGLGWRYGRMFWIVVITGLPGC